MYKSILEQCTHGLIKHNINLKVFSHQSGTDFDPPVCVQIISIWYSYANNNVVTYHYCQRTVWWESLPNLVNHS